MDSFGAPNASYRLDSVWESFWPAKEVAGVTFNFASNFASRFTGQFQARETGETRFELSWISWSSHSIRLYVDKAIVVGFPWPNSGKRNSRYGDIFLTAGQWYTFEVQHQALKPAWNGVRVKWRQPGASNFEKFAPVPRVWPTWPAQATSQAVSRRVSVQAGRKFPSSF